eukprot:m.70273 g.70273  ORF g.70273 m.70273 type:complete len:558 (-) comp7869_c2_seq1:2826-4499(-)
MQAESAQFAGPEVGAAAQRRVGRSRAGIAQQSSQGNGLQRPQPSPHKHSAAISSNQLSRTDMDEDTRSQDSQGDDFVLVEEEDEQHPAQPEQSSQEPPASDPASAAVEASCDAAASTAGMVPWFEKRQGVLVAHDANAAHLRRYLHVNATAIFGGARTGKSFLTNCIAGREEMARTSNDLATPCTSDVQMTPDVVALRDLATVDGGCPAGSDETEMMITLLDCEGQGDRGEAHDIALMAPLLLVTKVVLYNWKGGLEKNTILQRLGTLVKAASMIATSQNTTPNSTGKPFGHLHLVLRDWAKCDDEAAELVRKALFDDEAGDDPELVMRNSIRAELKANFESMQIWLFPPPRTDANDTTKILFVQRSELFMSRLGALRECICTQMLQPMEFNGQPLTGQTKAALVPVLIEAMNSTEKVIRPESAYGSMLKAEGSRASKAAQVAFERAVTLHTDSTDFISTGSLETALRTTLDGIMAEFRSKTAGLPPATAAEFEADLVQRTERELLLRLEQNTARLGNFLAAVIDTAETQLRDTMAAQLELHLPVATEHIDHQGLPA